MRTNPASQWFRTKNLGLGWSPATWEGWALTLAAAAAFIAVSRLFA